MIIPLLLISIVLVISVIIIGIWWLKSLRDRQYISKEFFGQLTSSIISGLTIGVIVALISFLSAYSLWKIQESKNKEKEKQAEEIRIADIRMDAFLAIANEIAENRLTLKRDIKSNALVRIPLNITAWEDGKYKLPLKTPLLKESLMLLYSDIKKYNWDAQFINYKVKTEKLTQEKIPDEAKKARENEDKYILDKLEELEKFTLRELVILEYEGVNKEEYVNRFGEWEDSIEISYYKK